MIFSIICAVVEVRAVCVRDVCPACRGEVVQAEGVAACACVKPEQVGCVQYRVVDEAVAGVGACLECNCPCRSQTVYGGVGYGVVGAVGVDEQCAVGVVFSSDLGVGDCVVAGA